MTKPFLAMLCVAVIFGVALGGAFVGGIVLGKSQSGEAGLGAGMQPGGQPGRQGISIQAPGNQGGPGQAQGSRGRPGAAVAGQRSPASGNAGTDGQGEPPQSQSPEQSAGSRNQPGSPESGNQDGPQQGQDDRGAAGRSGIGGAIESVDGDQLTITTPQGPVKVTAGAEVRIISFSEASKRDLTPGTQVRVMGPRGADGDVQANSILIVPEDSPPSGFFNPRPGPRGR